MIRNPHKVPGRLKNLVQFHIERFVVRGAQYRLLFIGVLIVLVTLVAGVLVYLGAGGFDDYDDALWWAFLRLTDPGYLGDDEGAFQRFISTIVTVLGYVLFMGALIAIMTQWLNERMRVLEMGVTPIAKKRHLIILGWTNYTADIVRDALLSSGRVKRFLRRVGGRRLSIVILAEEVTTQLAVGLREELGALWNPHRIIFRSGTPLRIEHLRRVDFLNAGAIVLPAGTYEHSTSLASDTRAIKTILSISRHAAMQGGRRPPLLVAELSDARKIPIARRAYSGRIEIVATDVVLGRLMAQCVRQPRLSFVFRELLTQGHGTEIFVRQVDGLGGRRFGDLAQALPQAIAIGMIREGDGGDLPLLCPPADLELHERERLVFMARDYDDCVPAPAPAPEAPDGTTLSVPTFAPTRRVLILGWSRRVPSLVREFDSYENEEFHIDIESRVPAAERDHQIADYGAEPRRVRLRHIEGNFIIPSDLEKVPLEEYDNILIVANDRLESDEESDARTLAGYLLLTDLMMRRGIDRPILMELMEAENGRLLAQFPHEMLITPVLVSHMLVQVALRPELNSVFEVLFGSHGPEIGFRAAADFDVTGRETTFADIQRAAAQRGVVALGIRRREEIGEADGGVRLNPSRTKKWSLESDDDLIVLAPSA